MGQRAVNGLTHAAFNAVQGIQRATRDIESGARDVAAGGAGEPGDPDFSRQAEALQRIKAASRQARANAAVYEGVDRLYRDLLRLNGRA
jgi:hypothetical protein